MRLILLLGLLLLAAAPAHADPNFLGQYQANDVQWRVIQSDVRNGQLGYCGLAQEYDSYITGLQTSVDRGLVMAHIGALTVHQLTPDEVTDFKGFLQQLGVQYRDADRRCRR